MAYDEGLAFRLRELLAERRDVVEKVMFGGLAFLIGGNMSVGIVGDDLLVRVGAARHDAALARSHARIMDFTGKPMKGWIFVAPEGIESDGDLATWVEWGVDAALTSKSKPMAKTAKRKTARATAHDDAAAAPKKKARKVGASKAPTVAKRR